MFRSIKLYFTNRYYYEQRKRYLKRQRAVRKKLKKLAKNFCPWSGYYMHEIIKVMLEFYHKTYLSGDCCWSSEGRIEEIATILGVANHFVEDLDNLDNLDDEELIVIAQKDKAFDKRVAAWEAEAGKPISEHFYKDTLLASIAYDYLERKYTKAIYSIIGEHIWEWCD